MIYFWLACASLIFLPLGLAPVGEETLLVRAIAASAGLVTVALVYRIGLLWKSELVGLLAASVLATSLGFFALTQTPGPSLFLFLGMALAFDISLRVLLGHGIHKTQRALAVFGVAFVAALASRHLWPSPDSLYFPELFPALTLGFFPWVVFLPKVIARWSQHKGMPLRRDEGGAFLVGTSALCLGLGWPALIPLSLLVAAVWEEDWGVDQTPAWVQRSLVVLGFAALLALAVLKWPTLDPSPLVTRGGLLGITISANVLILCGIWGMRRVVIAFAGILVAAVLLLGSLATLSTFLHADPVQNLLPPGTVQSPSGPIDPESPVEFSIAPIVEPPARVRLAEPRIRKDEWKGPRSAVTQQRQALFRHADAWERFWTKGLALYSPRLAQVPAVDFSKDMVVGVFLGERPDPHYDIEILSVRIQKRPEGDTLVVRYREPVRMQGVFSPPFAVQPFHLRRVPLFAGPIVFEKAQR